MTPTTFIKAKVIETHPTIKVEIKQDGITKQVQVQADTSNNAPNYKQGDAVVLVKTQGAPHAQDQYYLAGYNRTQPLFWLFMIFAILSVVVARKHGFFAIIGLLYSFLILFKVTLPLLLTGTNPVGVALLTALLISPVTFTLSHGMNSKTYVALAGTFISLFITALFSIIFMNVLHLTGFGSEEAMFLQLNIGQLDIRGLLLCGIIIGTLGILDDITVSQASIVKELKDANIRLTSWELYSRAMRVGRDHISSAINTLVLVYTGAALPLLLMFIISDIPSYSVVSYDIIAEEIARTLVSSIGLVLAVPITTAMAGIVFGNKKS